MGLKLITDSDFEYVLDQHEKLVIIYYADWCKKCTKIMNYANKLSRDVDYEDIPFVKIDVEKSPKARKSAKADYLPYVVLYKSSETIEGKYIKSKEEFVSQIDKLM